MAEERTWQPGSVDIGNICPHHQRRFFGSRNVLEMRSLPGSQLYRIRRGGDECFDRPAHVFDCPKERPFIEKTMVNGYVEAFAVGRKKPVNSRYVLHRLPFSSRIIPPLTLKKWPRIP